VIWIFMQFKRGERPRGVYHHKQYSNTSLGPHGWHPTRWTPCTSIRWCDWVTDVFDTNYHPANLWRTYKTKNLAFFILMFRIYYMFNFYLHNGYWTIDNGVRNFSRRGAVIQHFNYIVHNIILVSQSADDESMVCEKKTRVNKKIYNT